MRKSLTAVLMEKNLILTQYATAERCSAEELLKQTKLFSQNKLLSSTASPQNSWLSLKKQTAKQFGYVCTSSNGEGSGDGSGEVRVGLGFSA